MLSGVAGAEISKYQCSTNEGHLFNFDLDKNSKILIIHEKYNTWKKFKTTKLEITFIDDKILKIHNGKTTWNYGTDYKFGNMSLNCRTSNYSPNLNTADNFTFNIKQKKEQCKVMGFKPETERFADCVLRLVELDIKQQQSNKIAQAQQLGNDSLVKQLKSQQNDRNAEFLLNLGQQLLNPQNTNSNIYLPQTQKCTVSNFGINSVVRCY